MGRILGIDYGEVRMGLALTDPLKIIASAYKTIEVKKEKDIFVVLEDIVIKEDIEKIVLGIPFGSNGKKTKKTIEVEAFLEKLKDRFKIKIDTWDESFSSVKAHDVIHKMGKKTGNNKKMIDKIAAAIVLEDYLRYN